MAGIAKNAAQRRVRNDFGSVGPRFQLTQCALYFGNGVQRRACGTTGLRLFHPFRFFFLDVCGVGKHHLQQITGRWRGINRPGVAGGDQSRQQSGVIDMRMRQQYAVQRLRIKGEARTVFRFGFAATLEHTAIDQHFDVIGFEQKA